MKKVSFFIMVICLASCFGVEPQKTGKEGMPLPEFNMLLTDSTTWINTNKIPTGKPIAFFYLSPYCPYCKAQTKEIIENIGKLKDIQFYFITSFRMPAFKLYYNEYKLAKYPNIVTGIDTARFLGDYFEVPGVPYIAIYGKNKKLIKTFMGKINSSQLKKVSEE